MQSASRAVPATRAFPKLYNAKRRIEVSRGLLPAQLDFFKKNPLSETWRSQVSQDVVDFVDKIEIDEVTGKRTNDLLPEEKIKIFQNPSKYFSRPHNVPDTTRQQIHFPKFGVTFLRTPHLGPRYAQFTVPLWFGKLDLKSYLKNLYDVDVNHVRSFVVHRKKARKESTNRYARGQKVQPTFKKRMTAELVEPFIWPAEPSERELNNEDFAKDKFWESSQAGVESAQRDQAEFNSKPDKMHRRSIAEQAKALLAGREAWSPTWQHIPQDVRILQGRGRRDVSRLNSGSPSPMR